MTFAEAPTLTHSSSAALVRPLQLGLSIGHPIGPAGCLGPFVTLEDGRSGFLSAAHVLAPPKSKVGDFIHQPSPIEALTTGETRIAQLANYPAHVSDQPTLGIALAALLDGDAGANVVPDGLPDAGRWIQAPSEKPAMPGETVQVFGRRPGPTLGTISAVAVSGLRVLTPEGPVTFADCLELTTDDDRPLTEPGDAGALVCRTSDLSALALVFAAATGPNRGERTYALPLAPALTFFGLSWA